MTTVASSPVPPVARARKGAVHRGPPLAPVAAVHALLFVASLIVTTILAGGTHFPSPFQSPELSSTYFSVHARAVGIGACIQFGASIPLGIFTASVVSRLRFLGVDVAGVFIALFGGLAASLLLASSALFAWVLSQPEVTTSHDTTRALHLLAFAFGGPGCVVPLGLLVAGVAITGGLHRLLPRWLMWSGIVLAAVAQFSTLSLVVSVFAYLLPLARFPSFVWLVVAALMLPRARSRTATPDLLPERTGDSR
jgi:hypothetical protein